MPNIDYLMQPQIVIPPYRCEHCRATGVKLWRLGNLFGPLLCFDGAIIRVNAPRTPRPRAGQPAPRVLGSGMMVAAIPRVATATEITDFWGHQSTPQSALDWWNKLPLSLR